MKLVLFCIFSFITISSFALDVVPKNRVANQPPGYCMWASIESIGRQRGIQPLIGLVEARKKDPAEKLLHPNGYVEVLANHGGAAFAVERKLTQLGLQHYVQYDNNLNKNVLTYSEGYGCVIGIKPYTLTWPNPKIQSGYHAILLTKYSDSGIEFIDSNFPDKVFTGSKEWLDRAWTGIAIIVEFHSEK